MSGRPRRRVLIAWECGEELDRIHALSDLIDALLGRGHEVTVAARDLAHAQHVIPDGVRLLPAPIPPAATLPTSRGADFVAVLTWLGFAESRPLVVRLAAWRALFTAVRPALIVFHESPTALLAARGLRVARVLSSGGFYLPPPARPQPDANGRSPNPATLAAAEAALLAHLNELPGQAAPLGRLSDLLDDGDAHWLQNFPDLCQFSDGPGVHLLGTFPVCEATHVVDPWPAARSGRRALVKLAAGRGMDGVMQALCAADLRILVDGTELHTAQRDRWTAGGASVGTALGVPARLKEASLLICHGTVALVAAALRDGVPVLMLPLTPEQTQTAEHVAALGAGRIVARLDPGAVAAAASALSRSKSARDAARAFARRTRPYTAARALSRMVDDVERLLGGST